MQISLLRIICPSELDGALHCISTPSSGKYILFKNSFVLSHTYYWVFAFVHLNAQPTSILSFWSTSVKNILEDGQCVDVVLYHFNDSIRIAVGVYTYVAVVKSRHNQILSTTLVFFNSLVVI